MREVKGGGETMKGFKIREGRRGEGVKGGWVNYY